MQATFASSYPLQMRLRIDLVPLEPPGEVLSGDVPCTIGSGSRAELCLPRPGYAHVAQRQCQLELDSEGRVQLINLSPTTPCVLDGASLREQTIAVGEHLLAIGPSAFRLILKEA